MKLYTHIIFTATDAHYELLCTSCVKAAKDANERISKSVRGLADLETRKELGDKCTRCSR